MTPDPGACGGFLAGGCGFTDPPVTMPPTDTIGAVYTANPDLFFLIVALLALALLMLLSTRLER